MNEPDRNPAPGDDGGEHAGPGAESRAAPIMIGRKALVLWLVATAAAGSLMTAIAIVVTGHFHSQEEISRLEKALGKLTEEKRLAVKQLDDLRNSHYAQVIAERRCEVIDGLEDCLKAGLKRPARFAETDRQYLEAKRHAESRHAGQGRSATTGVTGGQAKAAGSELARPAPAATGKMSLDEFVQALGRIPGVAIDGSAADKPERNAVGKKESTRDR